MASVLRLFLHANLVEAIQTILHMPKAATCRLRPTQTDKVWSISTFCCFRMIQCKIIFNWSISAVTFHTLNAEWIRDGCAQNKTLLVLCFAFHRVGIPVLRVFGLEQLLYENNVDLAIWAHEHNYERFWPLYDYHVHNGSTKAPYEDPKATVHITVGSAVRIFCNSFCNFCTISVSRVAENVTTLGGPSPTTPHIAPATTATPGSRLITPPTWRSRKSRTTR